MAKHGGPAGRAFIQGKEFAAQVAIALLAGAGTHSAAKYRRLPVANLAQLERGGEESLSDPEVKMLRHLAEGNRNRDTAPGEAP
jgi:hypothetical protein